MAETVTISLWLAHNVDCYCCRKNSHWQRQKDRAIRRDCTSSGQRRDPDWGEDPKP